MFHANNAVSESANDTFVSGTLNLEIDGLLPETEDFIYNLDEPETVEIDGEAFIVSGMGTTSVSQTLGIGVVVEWRSGNVTSYSPSIFAKGVFRQGGDKAKTRGENVEWQTQNLVADLARDDTPKKQFRYNIRNFYSDEESARAALRKIMRVKEATA